jgi:sugar O-acyltransferase (sialic acid O-acetyltransferase NeuD family)
MQNLLMKEDEILIYGAGKTAITLAAILLDEGYSISSFVVDDEFLNLAPDSINSIQVKSFTEVYQLNNLARSSMLPALGYNNCNQDRAKAIKKLLKQKINIKTYISERALVSKNCSIGVGSLVFPGANLDPYSSAGAGSVLWSNSTLSHHSQINDYCWLASGSVVSGNSKIGECSFLGSNSTISNDVEIGKNCFVGANALITKSFADNSVFLVKSAELIQLTTDQYFGFTE